MTDVLVHNFEYIMKARERIILGLFVGIALLAASYVYFMEKTIADTVAVNANQSLAAQESQTVSDLSARYLALSQGITMSAALAAGFSETNPTAFIAAPGGASDLSINAF